MARQSTSPVTFKRSVRKDKNVLMTSARAGVVVPLGYVPLFAGDSASGRVGFDLELAEMPKPLLNAAHANFQAWFVPKSAFPNFSGRDELRHAMTGEPIKVMGQADRPAQPFFGTMGASNAASAMSGKIAKTLGLHGAPSGSINSDLWMATTLIYNFRLAAHSSRLARMKYPSEENSVTTNPHMPVDHPPAFWPSSRFSSVVPDYERALIVGRLDLDVVAGQINFSGTAPVRVNAAAADKSTAVRSSATGELLSSKQTLDVTAAGALVQATTDVNGGTHTQGGNVYIDPKQTLHALVDDIVGTFQNDVMGVTLANIDKARTTQAFARLRTAYAGNDATGFDNDDAIVSLLMQGIDVEQDAFKRPWLLDSKRVPIGFAERFATDAANLDQSVTTGRASAVLSLNVPKQDVTGYIVYTVEVLPERVDERQSDEFLFCTKYDDLPNALRDIQRPEPVDLVLNRRIDAAHSNPMGLYGYEPMNNKWNRDFTRLGGNFLQRTPGAGFTENRANIWQTEIVDPAFGTTHYLAPSPFPHDVFSDQEADAFEVVARHDVTITGLTQIGDVLAENNDDYDAIESSGV